MAISNKQLGDAQISRDQEQWKMFNDYLRGQLATRDNFLNPAFGQFRDLMSTGLDTGPNQGFSPQVLAALRGRAIDDTGRFNQQGQILRAALSRRGFMGGDSPISGMAIPGLVGLDTAREAYRGGALRDIMIQNEQQRLTNLETNRRFALARRGLDIQGLSSIIGGASGAYDPSAFIGGSSNALNAMGRDVETRMKYNQGGFWKTLLGAGIGALGNYFTGGFAGRRPGQEKGVGT